MMMWCQALNHKHDQRHALVFVNIQINVRTCLLPGQLTISLAQRIRGDGHWQIHSFTSRNHKDRSVDRGNLPRLVFYECLPRGDGNMPQPLYQSSEPIRGVVALDFCAEAEAPAMNQSLALAMAMAMAMESGLECATHV